MAEVVVQDGLEKVCLDWATKANVDTYKIGLYKNNYTPAVGDTISSITACDFDGYGGQLDLDAWDTGGITFVDDRAVVKHPVKTWTATGADTNNVYGYYVTTSGGVLLWAERRTITPVPFVVGELAGQTYTVEPIQRFGNPV